MTSIDRNGMTSSWAEIPNRREKALIALPVEPPLKPFLNPSCFLNQCQTLAMSR